MIDSWQRRRGVPSAWLSLCHTIIDQGESRNAASVHFGRAMSWLSKTSTAIVNSCQNLVTVGQCNAIENIQKRAIRVIYYDTDSDYESELIVARLESLKDRREMLMARFFKRQVLSSNALLHYLLPEQRDNDTVRSLRNSQPFPSIRARPDKFHKSFLPYCLKNFK